MRWDYTGTEPLERASLHAASLTLRPVGGDAAATVYFSLVCCPGRRGFDSAVADRTQRASPVLLKRYAERVRALKRVGGFTLIASMTPSDRQIAMSTLSPRAVRLIVNDATNRSEGSNSSDCACRLLRRLAQQRASMGERRERCIILRWSGVESRLARHLKQSLGADFRQRRISDAPSADPTRTRPVAFNLIVWAKPTQAWARSTVRSMNYCRCSRRETPRRRSRPCIPI